MREHFIIAARPQREWSWFVVVAFFLGGVGAGVFFLSLILGNLKWGLATGLVVVALGTNGAFVLDLGRPTRFWRAMLRPGTSWISRGILFILSFLLLGILYFLPFVVSGLPWEKGTSLGGVVGVLAALAALGVMTYTGFVLSYSPAIPFWNTTLLPIIFIIYANMGGTAVIFFLNPFLEKSAVNLKVLETLEIFLLLAAVGLILVYLLTSYYTQVGARESVRMILRGRLALPFFLGVVLVGLVIPLAISLTVYFVELEYGSVIALLVSAGILESAGGLAFRYCLVKGGIFAPVI